MQAPIALFVYNRIDHMKLVLQALNENDDADKSELYIFSDAPSDQTEEVNVAEVRRYLARFKENNRFQKVTIIEAERNKGLEKSLIEGITLIVNQYGKVIVMEDDHLTSKDFIRFMNQALAYYENDYKIWSVSGFTLDLKRLKHYKKDVYCGCRACCGGWGTWKDRWNKIDWDVSDYNEFIHDKKKIKEFNKGGMDMTSLLKLQHEGKVQSWAIRWCYQQYKEQMLAIFPRHSKVKNIGMDSSGTNSGSNSTYRSTLKAEKEWNFEYNEKDDWVFSEWRNYFTKLWFRQKLGALWYALTEYEYCMAYRLNKNEKYVVLKPNYKEWYSGAVPFDWKNEPYLFMVLFNKLKQQNLIAIAKIQADGTLTKFYKTNIKVSEASIPCVFIYNNHTYMMSVSEDGKEIRIYSMKEDITKWRAYCKIKCSAKIANAVVYNNKDSRLYILANEISEEKRFQSNLVLYQMDKLSQRKDVALKELWRQEKYTYDTLSGGNIVDESGRLYRVVRNGSSDTYSKFITVTKIEQISERGFAEKIVEKIGLANIPVELTPFIYRKFGVFSYGKTTSCEVACLWVQRFSLGGLFMKAYKLLRG